MRADFAIKIDRTLRGLFAGTVLLLGAAVPAWATDYYVDQGNPAASDSNSGTATLPWKTLSRAAKQDGMQPGDTVYVKPGTYAVSGGSWQMPSINPPASGSAGHPITFKALPAHGAILSGDGVAPPIGSANRNYVIIDGFVIDNPGPKGIAVFGSDVNSRVKGVVIQNNVITNVYNSNATDNTDGVRVEYASDVVVRNNLVRGVHNGTDTWNAVAVKLYFTDHVVIEHNEFTDMPTGVYDKEMGQNNIIRYNYIHDVSREAILLNTVNGDPAYGERIYQNVIARSGKAIGFTNMSVSDTFADVQVYNNVFAGYRTAGAYPQYRKSNGTVGFWNNIFYRSGGASNGDFYTYNDPPDTVALMDYNLYTVAPHFLVGLYLTNRNYNGLAAWQSATGHDINSRVGDTGFVNAGADDYHLDSGSPARGAGRVGGVPGGIPVNMGAYITGNEIIGIAADDNAPAAPRLQDVR